MRTAPAAVNRLPRAACGCSAGLTLIELLVVIAVIGVLAGLLLPALNTVRGSARSLTCSSNLRQVSLAADAYTTENNGVLVPTYCPNDQGYNGPSSWAGLLRPYLGDDSTGWFTIDSIRRLPMLFCPEVPRRWGFAHNYMGCGVVGVGTPWCWTVKRAKVASSSEQTYFTETTPTAASGATDPGDWTAWRPYLRNGGYQGVMDYVPSFNHRRGINVVWVDGHVSRRAAGDGWFSYDALGTSSPSYRWWVNR